MFVNHLEFLSVVFIDLPLRSFHGGCKNFLPRPRVYLLLCFEWYYFFWFKCSLKVGKEKKNVDQPSVD